MNIIGKISKSSFLPSAAITVPWYRYSYKEYNTKPKNGDLVYGEVISIGEHSTLENKQGRIRKIYSGTKGLFVIGNRYAPDYYEGFEPKTNRVTLDLMSRSGIIGVVEFKNANKSEPTKIRVLGHVCDSSGNIINTRNYIKINPKTSFKKPLRSKLILVVGTSMNSGKSYAAASCCRALSSAGHSVVASKITGTASLKDILLMNDCGADIYSDFTHMGWPSTYMLNKDELLDIFNKTDLRYANNRNKYWVVELADGILQRETAILLETDDVRSRIHKLVFCAADAFGAIGGVRILSERFGLNPDLISGVCSSSPLHIRELEQYSKTPILYSNDTNLKNIRDIIV